MKRMKSIHGPQRASRRDGQRGSVLVLALLVTMIILGIGLTVMWVASSATKVSGNLTRRQEAFNAAEAGIERARAVLFANASDWKPLLAGCGTGSPPDSDTIGRILCDSGSPILNTPLVPTSATPGTTGYETKDELKNVSYTVWIRNDWGSECDDLDGKPSKVDCDFDGTEETNAKGQLSLAVQDKNRRVIIRSRGIARDGISAVTLEVIISLPSAGGSATPSYNQAGGGAAGASSGAVVIAPPP